MTNAPRNRPPAEAAPCRGLRLRRHDREDIEQDACLKLLEAGGRERPHAWLAAVVRNAGLNRLKRDTALGGRRIPLDGLAAPDAADPAQRHEAIEAVRAAVGRLPAAQQAVVRLAMAGRCQAGVAGLAGCSTRTVRRHLRLALATLRRELSGFAP